MNQPLIKIAGTGISIKVGGRTFQPEAPREQSDAPTQVIVRETRSSKRDRKVRSTSFNVRDPLERQLNAHADRFSCFSTYVKRLIHEDVMRGNTSASSTPREDRYYDAMTSDVAAGIGGGK